MVFCVNEIPAFDQLTSEHLIKDRTHTGITEVHSEKEENAEEVFSRT